MKKPEIDSYHNQFHSQIEEKRLTPEAAVEIFDSLSNSPLPDHQIDAAWILLDLAEDLTPQVDAEQGLNFIKVAEACLDRAAESGTRVEAMKAQYIKAFLPSYCEYLEGSQIDKNQLAHRLIAINKTIVKEHDTRPSPRLRGLANEVAVATLMSFVDTGESPNSFLAWPAASWQDEHQSSEYISFAKAKSRNYDLNFGTFPLKIAKVQVKSFIEQGDLAQKLHTNDGDKLLEYWRERYERLVCIIFAETHMSSTKDDLLKTNRLLASPKAHKNEIERMIQNVMEEILDHCEKIHLSWLDPARYHCDRKLVQST